MTPIKLPLCLVLFLFILSGCQSENPGIKSLELAIASAPEATCCRETREFFQENPEDQLPDSLAQCLEQKLATLDTAAGAEAAIRALCRFGQAFELSVSDRYIESNEIGEEGLKLAQSLPGTEEGLLLLADYYNMIGINYQRLFDIGKSLLYSQKAGSIYRSLEKWEGCAREKINQGVALNTAGRLAEAEQSVAEAWDMINRYGLFEDKPEEWLAAKNLSGIILFNKAQQAYDLGKTAESQAIHRQAIDTLQVIRRRLATQEDGDVNVAIRLASTCFSIAGNYGLRRLSAEADSIIKYGRLFREVLDSYGDFSYAPPYQYSYVIEAVGLAEKGNHRLAAEKLVSGMNGLGVPLTTVDRLPELVPSGFQQPQLVANGIFNQARILRKRYDQRGDFQNLERALAVRREGIELLERMRVQLVSEVSGQSIRAGIWNVYGEGIADAMLLYEKTGAERWKEAAYRLAEQSKAFTLRQRVKRRLGKRQLTGNEASLLKREQDIRNAILQARSALAGAGEEEREQLFDRLTAAYGRYESFLKELRTSTEPGARQYYAERFDNAPPAVDRIQELLDNRTAVLEYVMSGPQGWCFVLTQNGFEVVEISTKEGTWSDLSKRLKMNLEPPGGAALPEIAPELYDILIASVKPLLSDGIDRLIIVPDGDLSAVSFESLFAGSPGEGGKAERIYLIEDYAVSYLPSLATLDYLRRFDAGPEGENSFAAFISRYAGLEDLDSEPLRCSDRPLEVMAQAVSRFADKFKRSGYESEVIGEAQEQQFADRAGRRRILQLAAHGCIENLDPIQYALLFSTDPEQLEKNVLTVGEIYQLDLDRTRMIVLSNCSTGSGVIRRGEGVASMARAFIYAGCPSLVTANNEVLEGPTAEILDHFYDQVLAGEPLDIAMQRAKLSYMEGHPGEHPGRWANLVVFGDARPLQEDDLQ